MKLIFDKDTDNEREIELGYLSENISQNRMNGSRFINTKKEDIPDLTPFEGNPDFSTIELHKKDGTEVQLQGDYNYIADLSVVLDDLQDTYNVSIIVIKKAEVARDV